MQTVAYGGVVEGVDDLESESDNLERVLETMKHVVKLNLECWCGRCWT